MPSSTETLVVRIGTLRLSSAEGGSESCHFWLCRCKSAAWRSVSLWQKTAARTRAVCYPALQVMQKSGKLTVHVRVAMGEISELRDFCRERQCSISELVRSLILVRHRLDPSQIERSYKPQRRRRALGLKRRQPREVSVRVANIDVEDLRRICDAHGCTVSSYLRSLMTLRHSLSQDDIQSSGTDWGLRQRILEELSKEWRTATEIAYACNGARTSVKTILNQFCEDGIAAKRRTDNKQQSTYAMYEERSGVIDRSLLELEPEPVPFPLTG